MGVAGFERLFAIKILHPHLAHEEEFIAMFLDEARLAARIRHPNVVATTDISDTPDSGYYLVMDYVEGDHLGALMRQVTKDGTQVPFPTTIRILTDALNGLSAAHEITDESGQPLHLVHRDISPQNIMVGTDGISRLTDFGVAKATTRLGTTREGQFKGKLAYMSPEHASDGKADQRSDLFAMGTILWECLTGRRLFRAENHAATLNLICIEPIPLPSSVDPTLEPFDPILDKALQRDPEMRFQSAIEMADALESKAHTLGGTATQRTISNFVKKFANEKLNNDRLLIQNAIADVSSGEIPLELTTPVQESTPEGVIPYASQEISSSGARMVSQTPSSSYPILAEQGRNKTLWLLGGLGIAIVTGIMVTFVIFQMNRESDVITSPLKTLESTGSESTPEKPTTSPPIEKQIPAATAEKEPIAEKPDTDVSEGISSEADSTAEKDTEGKTSDLEAERRPVKVRTIPRSKRKRRTKPSSLGSTASSPTQKSKEFESKPQKPTKSSTNRSRKKSLENDLLLNPYR